VAHILVVDDDETTREFLTDVLEWAGHHVEVADRGAAALAYLRHTPVELIVLDLWLPHMGGTEFAHQYHRLAGATAAPIVLVSASRKDQLPQAAEAMGAAGFLEKPFDLEQFLALVQQVLESSV
jgi:CheY-like chemotaxis protein